MFWDKWFKATPKSEAPTNPPRIVFELHKDGNILIGCSWPTPQNEAEAVEFVQHFTMMLYMINTGRLIGSIQHSIARFNPNNQFNAQLSKAILNSLDMVIKQYGGLVEDNKSLVVHPTEVFSVRGVSE